MKKYFLLSIFTIILLPAFIVAKNVSADTGILPACAATGRCSLCDLIQVAINFGEFLFGIVGALVLLYFFYGGFLMLTSAGEGGKVKKGKDVLVNSVIGLMIVFLAYSGVNFIIGTVAKTGWNWTGILTAPKACAPLPTAIPWTAPSAGQGAGGPPAGGASGPVSPSVPAITPTASTNIDCTDTNYSDAAPCDPADSDKGTWCNGAHGKCQYKRNVGQPCVKDTQCINRRCSTNDGQKYCIAKVDHTQGENQFCMDIAQCTTGLVCIIAANLTDPGEASVWPTGNCQKPLGQDQPCQGRGIPHSQTADNAICASPLTCKAGNLGETGRFCR